MKLIKILLLLSLLFNITHASVIFMEDECHHDAVTEHMMEQNMADEYGDLCDMHCLFHFVAIINILSINFDNVSHTTRPTHEASLYHPPFKRTATKPPIV